MRITNQRSIPAEALPDIKSAQKAQVASAFYEPCGVAMEAALGLESQTTHADSDLDLLEIQAQAIGWIPLDAGAYLHTSASSPLVIDIVGIASASMITDNVVWLI